MDKYFEEYVSKFDMNNPKIKRKYDHTYRVYAISKILAKKLNLNEKIAGLCGLYHDIGRFYQVKEYDTFNDLESIDHGDLGYKLFNDLFKDKYDLTDREINIISDSIKYHNKLEIGNVDDETLKYCHLTRDADKIDILFQATFMRDFFGIHDEAISKKCDEYFMKHELLRSEDMQNNNDHNLCMLAFVYDIHYDESYDYLIKNKYFEKIEKKHPYKEFSKYYEEINKFLKEKENGK